MELLIEKLCCILIDYPVALALVLIGLFAAVGYVHMSGIKGRRRLYDKKADKDVVEKSFTTLRGDFLRLEKRIYDHAEGKPQDPLPPEVLAIINHKKT